MGLVKRLEYSAYGFGDDVTAKKKLSTKRLESSLERACVREAKKRRAVFLKIERRKGWPDRLLWALLAVVPVFVELKRKGEEPTKLQAHIHRELRSQGITVYIVRSLEQFKELL